MAFTEDQKQRMFEKLKTMKSGTFVKLNKNDACPIECRFKKNDQGMYFISTELGKSIVSAGGVPGDSLIRWFIKRLEQVIDNWDLVTKQYFIDLAKKQGLDP